MPSDDDYHLLLPNRFRERQFLHKVAIIVFACSVFFCISFFVSSFFQSKYTKPSILACQTPKYDYNVLAIRWTPTFCSSRKCVNATEDWDIHGLWPSWANSSQQGPFFCCRVWDFSQNEIKTLLPQLNEEWPNQLRDQSQDSLWKHEWSKHGTCSTIARSGGMIGYFNTTLSLFAQYPIKNWLNEAGIKPTAITDESAYTLEQIHQAIESKINKTIKIQCVKSRKTKVPLLDTIYLCFHSSSMELINCPIDRCTSKKIILPQSHQ